MNRTRWIAAAVLVVLIILCAATAALIRNAWKSRQGTLGHRAPLPGFAYCSSSEIRPCILSFNSNPDGTMVINILARGYAEDFYIKIRRDGSEHVYTCQRARRYSTQVACVGESMPTGETLSFLVVSTQTETLLAEGSFPIIGMALATPEVYITPTPILIDRPPK